MRLQGETIQVRNLMEDNPIIDNAQGIAVEVRQVGLADNVDE